MTTTHAVGIDLGTTYSCIACLNEHGDPITLANEEGELSTPSVVLFDDGEVVVGTEALRNAILHPDRVVQNSKRFIGDSSHRWVIDARTYTPVDIASYVLKKLLSSAQRQIGAIDHAVVTVPAQFSDAQRHATIEAAHRAGLQRVDIINEPVAAALCHVLGTAGMWFSELANEQRILVYDLGGGTFDLSLVSYQQNQVKVIASSGDLHLGGIDWNAAMLKKICKQFASAYKADPRKDPSSLQALALEVEQTKRGLSVRPRAPLTCQHDGHRKIYQIELDQFERLTQQLVDRTAEITLRMLEANGLGWAHVDTVLLTGGASRMPMIRRKMKELSGRTLNTSLSPDLSIAHGATFYAGMLLSNDQFARSILNPAAAARLSQVKQQSVNARGLGILVRDPKSGTRIPHYLIPANTPLPASATNTYGTVVPNQKRVHLQIVESGITPEATPAILGACVIDDLPPDLPIDSGIAVTISYDASARVHLSAKEVKSGKQAQAEIIRQENLVPQLAADLGAGAEVALREAKPPRIGAVGKQSVPKPKAESSAEIRLVPLEPATPAKVSLPRSSAKPPARKSLDSAEVPMPLCNECGEPLDVRGQCPAGHSKAGKKVVGPTPAPRIGKPVLAKKPAPPPVGKSKPAVDARKPSSPPKRQATNEDDFSKLMESEILNAGSKTKLPSTKKRPKPSSQRSGPPSDEEIGEDEFWKLVE